MSNRLRSGSVLIVVVGLAGLMLTLVVVINRQLKADVQDGVLVMRDAQARMMLPSALGFILEYGRLGGHQDGECFGWTDIRDGGVGPRGPRSSDGSLPPEPGGSSWPAPGSVYRGDLYVQTRPRHAVRLTRAYNPVQFPDAWLDEYEAAEDKSGTALWPILRPQMGAGRAIGFVPANDASDNRATRWYWTKEDDPILTDQGMREHWGRVWSEILRPMDEFQPGFHHSLTPQPVADTWDEFDAADPRPLSGSTGLAWFRIYRERPEDHDGDGSPWFDTMALSGHGIFIVTCGAGGTHGYRDWAEVQADGAGDRFLNDRYFFEDLRAQERLLWYRVAWSGFTSGGFDYAKHYRLSFGAQEGAQTVAQTGLTNDFSKLHTQTRVGSRSREGRNAGTPMLNTLGTIAWIERLDREPVAANGRPLW